MEQRRLRLGDILDDYCPRERRVTNHAVVAMVEEDVKQTRCTTCDTEHVYKGAKAPRRRKTETTGRLYKQVLAGLTDPETAAASANGDLMDETEQAPNSIDDSIDAESSLDASTEEPIEVVAEVMGEPESSQEVSMDDESEDQPPMLDEGPVHRPLIRAQLPRVEGLKLERQAPEFTIRQNAGRGNGHFRGGGVGGGGVNNGQRFGRGPQRSGGGPSGGGRGGAGQGFGRGPGGNQPRQGGGGRKRGR